MKGLIFERFVDDKRINLFGCLMDPLRMPDAVARIYDLIADRNGMCHYVVTPNVQHVVMLDYHEQLQRAYKSASLVLADGMPLVVASRLLGCRLPERVAGADLVRELFVAAGSRGGMRVFLLGAGPGVAKIAANKIMARWPAVEVVGVHSPSLGFETSPVENAKIQRHIAASRPDVVVVGLGAPKQELWVYAHRSELQAAVALCAGATIDFLAGHKRRAPRWMQKSGLEWLYRLATEPCRLWWRYAHDAWYFPGIVWREWRRRKAVNG